MPDWVLYLPHVNASLNGASFVLLTAGYVMIRRGKREAHRACMLSCLAVSVLFLVSYVTYHSYAGSKPFPGTGWVRPAYFAMLVSHIVLAAAIVPLAIVTIWQAHKERFARHKRIARWTLPLWIYVSLTGLLVYALLYHVYAA